jgi:hypothetical protein
MLARELTCALPCQSLGWAWVHTPQHTVHQACDKEKASHTGHLSGPSHLFDQEGGEFSLYVLCSPVIYY